MIFEKHHSKIRKATTATSVASVAQSMLDDENTALLSVLPDALSHADSQVGGISKLIAKASNPDHVIIRAVESPMAFNSALALNVAGSEDSIEELAQFHLINRVLCASQPGEDTTFNAK